MLLSNVINLAAAILTMVLMSLPLFR